MCFNEKVEISVGGEDDDFCFTIADLLPHLAKDQLSKNATEFIDAEKMSVLVGNIKDDLIPLPLYHAWNLFHA